MDQLDPMELIRTLDYGGCQEELAQAVIDMIRALAETKKSGSITLKLDFVPVSNTHQFWVKYSVNSKEPVKANADTIFFYDNNFRPSRNDPRQLELRELREAGG